MSLFEKAKFGLSFRGAIKQVVAQKLKNMQGRPHFEQLLHLLQVLQILSSSNEFVILNEQDTSVKSFLHDKIRMGSVYNYIHANYDNDPNVNTVAASVHLSTSAFCRYFKKQTKMTFTDFVNQYRITQAKTLLLKDMSVSAVCFDVGFESLSYFNKLFNKITGENPSTFRKRQLALML